MKENENCQEIDWEFKFNIIMCLQLGNADVNEIKVQTIKLVLSTSVESSNVHKLEENNFHVSRISRIEIHTKR